MLHFIHKFTKCRFNNHSECIRNVLAFQFVQCLCCDQWPPSAVYVQQSDTCNCTIWCRKQHKWNVFALNQQKCCQVTWQMKKTVIFNYTLIQFCLCMFDCGGSILNRSPVYGLGWFVWVELIDAVRGMVKQLTEICWHMTERTLKVLSVLRILNKKVPQWRLWPESHPRQQKVRGETNYP